MDKSGRDRIENGVSIEPAADPKSPSRAARLAMGSIAVGLAVLGLKAVSAWLTGSLAFFSDALESSINVIAALVAFWAVRYSGRPADQDHPYGHEKAEYFAAVLEGVLIVCAAALIVYSAVPRLFAPVAVALNVPGIGLSLVASLINYAWARTLLREAAALRSPALAADGRHIMSDVVSSVGTGAGVVIAMLTGWSVLDPLLAIFVAGSILWSGSELIRASVGGLMDMAPDAAMRSAIDDAIRQSSEGAIEAHDIRSRVAGAQVFIEFHLVVPGEMSVSESHQICDRIELGIRQRLGQANISIHVEPAEKAKHKGIVLAG
jgi:cation diffusion facilitator family transporter